MTSNHEQCQCDVTSLQVMMSPLRSTFEGYRLPDISNVLVQLAMLLHQHCRKYHSKCVYHIAGVEKIY